MPSRRSVLRAVTLTALAFPFGRAAAQSVDPGLRLRGVAVDVTPLLDHGGGASARALAQIMLPQMRQVFADRLSPGDTRAPLLTARIRTLFFSDDFDRGSSFGLGNNDSIEGEGIVTSGRQVMSSTHVLTELSASYSGSRLLPDHDVKRLVSIGYQFAYWLRREMNL